MKTITFLFQLAKFLEMSEFKQQYLLNLARYFDQIFRIFQTDHVFSQKRRMNVEIMYVLKIALSRSGLLINQLDSVQRIDGST